MPILAEYIWIDGADPTPGVRSKTKVLPDSVPVSTSIDDVTTIDMSLFPEWGADGSSTSQAEGRDSDIILKPVAACRDPFRPGGYLVMTEVFNADGTPNRTNYRAGLRAVLEAGAAKADAWFGFEQEYTFFHFNGGPLGFPINGYPGPQGPYYCGVGAMNIAGREIYEAFMANSIAAGLLVAGFNWEVMPGQAEFQVGAADGLTTSDHLWLARWILKRTAEPKVEVSFDPKPAQGDWNGAGMHTNFSTAAMRSDGGFKAIEEACVLIGERRQDHLDEYGDNYQARLTGHHETCSWREFKWGVADRTASIRVPRSVADTGKGYLEDRRPNANADPYRVAARLLKTVCKLG
ncbi:MAG: glutamine synthetase beta-grasp domain-containing protein [Myxococcales bacterium]|nr:glutamine synthetase beta-grasp domain-containing protein [Myxococcales bacterium]